MNYYQQGDVLIKEVDYKPEGKELNHLILAKGEKTGHHHSIVNGLGKLIIMDKVMHLSIFSKKATLNHQEHGAIDIPKGNYKIEIVREYDHFKEEAKQASD
jgi:hypothetical protein